MLREVHLLERLRHPNIVSYKHAWLEYSQPSPFGKLLPTSRLFGSKNLPCCIHTRPQDSMLIHSYGSTAQDAYEIFID